MTLLANFRAMSQTDFWKTYPIADLEFWGRTETNSTNMDRLADDPRIEMTDCHPHNIYTTDVLLMLIVTPIMYTTDVDLLDLNPVMITIKRYRCCNVVVCTTV